MCVPAWDLAGLAAREPLLEELERRGGLLFVHPGPASVPKGAPAWWPTVVDYTAQMQAAYAALDRARCRPLARPARRLRDPRGRSADPARTARVTGVDTRSILRPNVFLDTASYGERALELALATYGVAQLVYGSDTPVIDSEQTLRSVRSFGRFWNSMRVGAC